MRRFLLHTLFLSLASPAAFAACTIAGDSSAALVIEEFADFHCSYCAKGAATMKEVANANQGKVKVVFRNLPLSFHNPGATEAAKAFSAVCIQNPAVAEAFQNTLFENQGRLISEGEKYFTEVADKLGIDTEKMKEEMKGAKVAKLLQEDLKAAERLGIKGTPSFLIGNEVVVGARPLSDYQKVIDQQLKK